MTNQNKRIILITGSSSGIGKACFDYLTSVGHVVYGTSRRADGSDPQMLKVNVINAVLPHMRNQKKGHLINVSSLAGLFAIPYQAFYTASKYALEGYSEGLRMELLQFGIQVSLIEPGDFRTEISDNREFSGAASEGIGDYHHHFEKTKTIIIKGERDGADVMRIAKLVNRIIQSPFPGLRYTIGKPIDLLGARIKKLIPQRLFEWLIRDHYKIN